MVPMINTTEAIKGATWNKDGTTFAYADGNTIIVRSSEEYSPMHELKTSNGNILFMKFTQSTSGEGLDQLATLTDTNVLNVRILPYEEPIFTVYLDETETPSALAYSYNGNYIATGSAEGTVTLFFNNYMTNNMTSRSLGKCWGAVKSLCFSQDSKYLIASDDEDHVKIWDVTTGNIHKEFSYFGEGEVPVIVSNDSQYLFVPTGPTSLGVYNINHEFLNQINTTHYIVSIDFSADGEFIIILTSDNKFSFYDYETTQMIQYIPNYNSNPVSSYAFNNTTTKLLIGHTDGSSYILNLEDVLLAPYEEPPSYFMIAADDPETLKKMLELIDIDLVQGASNVFHFSDMRGKDKNAVEFELAASTIVKPYGFTLGGSAFYKNFKLFTPFYFGGGLSPYFGIPVKFPYIYEDIYGRLKNPLLLGIRAEAPVGLLIYPFANGMPLFTEATFGVNVFTLWNQKFGQDIILLKPYTAFNSSLKVGFEYKNFKIAIQSSYDTILKFSFGIILGFNLNLPINEEKENTLDEES